LRGNLQKIARLDDRHTEQLAGLGGFSLVKQQGPRVSAERSARSTRQQMKASAIRVSRVRVGTTLNSWWACHVCSKRACPPWLLVFWKKNRSMHGTKADHHRQVKRDKRRWLCACCPRGLVDTVQVLRRTHRGRPRWQPAATCSSVLWSSVPSTVAALVRLELVVVLCLVER
jgi:hypothetical protein